MKYRIVFIIFVLLTKFSLADLGYCYKFKVKFNLTNDSTVIAFFIHPDYNYEIRNITTLDSLLEGRNKSREVKVYKELYSLDSLGLRTAFACKKDDILRITIEDIKTTEVLECDPCCPINKLVFTDIDYGFCGMPVIEELSIDEIIKLQHEKPYLITSYSECFEIDLQNVLVISYNTALTETWIMEKLRLKCCTNYESYKKLNTQYRVVKEELRSKDIILIKTSIPN